MRGRTPSGRADASVAAAPGRSYRTPHWFTPINEPGITALMSTRFGMWNDRLATADDPTRALVNIVLANREALAGIRADREASWIGAEGFDMPVAMTGAAEDEVARRRALGWLVWDLHFGRDPLPAVEGYLSPVADDALDRIRRLAVTEVGLEVGL